MNTMTSMKGGSYFDQGQDVLSNPSSMHPSPSDYLTRHLYEAMAKIVGEMAIKIRLIGSVFFNWNETIE